MKIVRPKLQGERIIKLNDHASPGHASPTTSQPENRLEGRTIVDDLLTVRF